MNEGSGLLNSAITCEMASVARANDNGAFLTATTGSLSALRLLLILLLDADDVVVAASVLVGANDTAKLTANDAAGVASDDELLLLLDDDDDEDDAIVCYKRQSPPKLQNRQISIFFLNEQALNMLVLEASLVILIGMQNLINLEQAMMEHC